MEVQLEDLRKKHRLRVYVPWGLTTNAIIDYRALAPLRTMERAKLLDFAYDAGGLNPVENATVAETRLRAMSIADIHLYHGIIQPELLKLVMHYPGADRPTVIYSADDNIEWIEPFNSVFTHMGTRNLHGELLAPGDEIRWVDPSGADRILWKDGCVYNGHTFDIERNTKRMALLRLLAAEADGVLMSTPHLAEVYKSYGARNVYVYPNSLNFEENYPKFDVGEHPEVRILWCGGSSHFIDLWPCVQSLVKVLNKHKNAKLVIFGQQFDFFKKHIAPEQFEFVPWVEFPAYPFRLATLAPDINLCPLRDTPFNWSKSAIKWYEPSAIARPAATLAANIGPYQEIEDGETGFLYDNMDEFEDKLERLILDKANRQRLAAGAAAWVREHRDIKKTSEPFFDWLRDTYEKTSQETL